MLCGLDGPNDSICGDLEDPGGEQESSDEQPSGRYEMRTTIPEIPTVKWTDGRKRGRRHYEGNDAELSGHWDAHDAP